MYFHNATQCDVFTIFKKLYIIIVVFLVFSYSLLEPLTEDFGSLGPFIQGWFWVDTFWFCHDVLQDTWVCYTFVDICFSTWEGSRSGETTTKHQGIPVFYLILHEPQEADLRISV